MTVGSHKVGTGSNRAGKVRGGGGGSSRSDHVYTLTNGNVKRVHGQLNRFSVVKVSPHCNG